MAWTTNPYCTVADVQSALSKTLNGADTTWVTNSLIPQAQADIDGVLGYSFQTDSNTRTYSGNGCAQMMVERLQSLTSVVEKSYAIILTGQGVYQSVAAGTVDITNDVVLGPDPNVAPFFILERLSGLPFLRARNNYILTGVFGAGTAPPPIQRACTLLAVHYYKIRDTAYGQQQVQSGPNTYAVKINRSWPEDVCATVYRYMRKGAYSR